jgi:hypothetical protein
MAVVSSEGAGAGFACCDPASAPRIAREAKQQRKMRMAEALLGRGSGVEGNEFDEVDGRVGDEESSCSGDRDPL